MKTKKQFSINYYYNNGTTLHEEGEYVSLLAAKRAALSYLRSVVFTGNSGRAEIYSGDTLYPNAVVRV